MRNTVGLVHSSLNHLGLRAYDLLHGIICRNVLEELVPDVSHALFQLNGDSVTIEAEIKEQNIDYKLFFVSQSVVNSDTLVGDELNNDFI